MKKQDCILIVVIIMLLVAAGYFIFSDGNAKDLSSGDEVQITDVLGIYDTTIWSEDALRRNITLHLYSDNKAMRESTYGPNVTTETGSWRLTSNNQVRVKLTADSNSEYDQPKITIYDYVDGRLKAVKYNGESLTSGVTLTASSKEPADSGASTTN